MTTSTATPIPSEFDEFPCVEVVDPGREDLEQLSEEFRLHELAIEDAIKAHQRPKLERYGDSWLLVVKSAHYDDAAESVNIGETLLMFSSDFLVIVRHDPGLDLDLRSERCHDADPNPAIVVHRILDQIVDGYAPVVAGFENDVREVEETVFSADNIYPTERIYRLKRQLLKLIHAIRPMIAPLEMLIDSRASAMGDNLMEYYRDVTDHLRRVVSRAERASELVSEMLDANLAQVSLQQNEDQRKMSAWAAIFLLPTVLAGIWGMNFEEMPEVEWVWGYPVALGIMGVGVGLLYWRFRKSGWL